MPNPLPKCLSPVEDVALAGDRAPAPAPGSARRLRTHDVAAAPGSEVIVPHWRPSAADANAARRCSCHAPSSSPSLASQIAQHRGMHREHAARPTHPRRRGAATRRTSARVDAATDSHRPPCSTGTAARRKPDVGRSASKSSRSRCRRAWRSARSPCQRVASASMPTLSSAKVLGGVTARSPARAAGPVQWKRSAAGRQRVERLLGPLARPPGQ